MLALDPAAAGFQPVLYEGVQCLASFWLLLCLAVIMPVAS